MHDDNSILRNPELWLAALVSCGPAVLIATLMIMSMLHGRPPVILREIVSRAGHRGTWRLS